MYKRQGVAEDRLDNPNDPSDVERDKSKDKDKDKDGDGPTYLYYPRDIATLRSAYEEQSILSSPKQQTNTTLRGDLSELESIEHDTVRSYGGQLTPLALSLIHI